MANAQEITITTPETGFEAPAAKKEEEGTKPEGEETLEGTKPEGEETPKEGDKEPEAEAEKAAADAAAEAGIDMAATEAHFLEHGEVPAATYEKAAKVGITKEMVDEFVEYRVSQADRVRNEMMEPFGGNDAVDGMMQWAGENWTEGQIKSFNEATASGNRGQLELALKALKSDFDKTNGVKPKLLNPATPAGNSGGAYKSLQEMAKDQADPRYRTDPAFRAAVMAKLGRSKI